MRSIISLSEYLSSPNSEKRISLLKEFVNLNETIALTTAENLLCLDLSTEEKVLLVELAYDDNNELLEQFYLDKIDGSHQNIGVAAFQMWVEKTDHINWKKIVELSKSKHLSQRLKYRFLDEAFSCGGVEIVQSITKHSDILELSPAFHGILLLRALQWDYECKELVDLSLSSLEQIKYEGDINKRLIIASIAYIKCHVPEKLNAYTENSREPFLWSEILETIQRDTLQFNKSDLDTLSKSSKTNDLKSIIPNTWNRHKLSTDDLNRMMTTLFEGENKTKDVWQFFSGSNTDKLIEALVKIDDDSTLSKALQALSGLLPFQNSKKELSPLVDRISGMKRPFINQIPRRMWPTSQKSKPPPPPPFISTRFILRASISKYQSYNQRK